MSRFGNYNDYLKYEKSKQFDKAIKRYIKLSKALLIILALILIMCIAFIKADEKYNDYQKYKQNIYDNKVQSELDSLNFEYKSLCEK